MYPSPKTADTFTISAAEVRKQSRVFRQVGIYEASPELRRLARSHAIALAQVAEAIEKRGDALPELRR